MINCFIHDVACCRFWKPAVNPEMNGNVLIHIGADRPGGRRGSGRNIGGPPAIGGVYQGQRVTLPMVGMGCPQPWGTTDAITPSEQTGTQLNVFVVVS